MRSSSRPLTALLLAGSLALAACGGDATDPVAEAIDDTIDRTETATDAATDATADGSGVRDATDGEAEAETDDREVEGGDRPDHTGSNVDGFTVEPEGQELALVGNDTVEILYTLDPEGESHFTAAAVQPGSTRAEMTVVVITQAEGMYDLRWLEVAAGQVGDLEVFPSEHRMVADVTAYEGLTPTVVWSPDGGTIGWFEPGEDGAVLRTVGWNDGPGTGDPADDNASWGIEQAPEVLQARGWEVGHSDGSQTILTAEDGEGASYRLHLERQGDEAWAYHGPAA